MNNKTPSYLKGKLPPKYRPFFNSPLFNVFHEIKFKTNRYMNSFFPHAISSWNIIILHFEDFPSFDSLKDHVLSLVRPVNKSIFGVHDPLGLRYVFRLRVSLSPLRSHKSRHNFIDTPSDICHCKQGVEYTSHFLFICSSYVTQRASLTSCVSEILLKNNLNRLENQLQLYLYGHDSINYADNRKILISTLKYIKFCSLGGWVVGGHATSLSFLVLFMCVSVLTVFIFQYCCLQFSATKCSFPGLCLISPSTGAYLVSVKFNCLEPANVIRQPFSQHSGISVWQPQCFCTK